MPDDDFEIPDEPKPARDDGVPFDNASERAVLGALVLSPTMWSATAATGLVEGDFLSLRNQTVWRSMVRLQAAGQPVDLGCLRADLAEHGELERAGGPAYLVDLLDGMAKGTSAEYYAASVVRLAHRRRHMEHARVVTDCARSGSADDLETALDQLVEGVAEAERSRSQLAITSIDDAEPDVPKWLVKDLLPKTGLVVIWARPNAGKTFALLRWCYELLGTPTAKSLMGHPDLSTEYGVDQVLWVATEETAGRLRYRADMVRRGLGDPIVTNDIKHVFAADRRAPADLYSLPALLDRVGGADLVILDSLTGLRPKTLHGEKVKWDADNDATNEVCLYLRGLAEERQCCIVIVHHTGREEAKGYRGPTEWLASTDVMLGLVPDPVTAKLKIKIEKNRLGKVMRDFMVAPIWGERDYRLEYDGAVVWKAGNRTQDLVMAFLEGRKAASQAEIITGVAGRRSTVVDAIKAMVEAGVLVEAGAVGLSPIYEVAGDSPEEVGSVDGG